MLLYEAPLRLELIGRTLYRDGKALPCTSRKISEMAEVLMDAKKAFPDGVAYSMYREVFVRGSLRYDITVILPRLYGDEYAKTYGHYHSEAKKGLTYPELYQILSGEGMFIMQMPRRDDRFDCIFVKCKKGDVVLIPPNYGHVLVNLSAASPLVSCNVVSNSFSADYSGYKENHGAAYFCTKDGLVQNMNCLIGKTETLTPRATLERYKLEIGDLLEELSSNPQKLQFLEDPFLLTL
ncbi:MAG: glucose-6-phosphate isomerase family protein [Candidatus Bilamarchaeaceae archaeon]